MGQVAPEAPDGEMDNDEHHSQDYEDDPKHLHPAGHTGVEVVVKVRGPSVLKGRRIAAGARSR